MEKYDVIFKKKLGQNFLKDEFIINDIVEIADITKDSLVIEVGPGGGILTRKLAATAGNVIAYEIDNSLEKELSSRIGNLKNVEVIYGDFLKANINDDINKYSFDKLFFISNVPYYITTPILNKIVDSKIKFNKIVMMVQKEVGERICAKPGSKEYGSISVFLNYYFSTKIEFFVSRDSFVPKPNVDSVVISFCEKEREKLIDYDVFEKLVYDSFKHKRKNLKNNLVGYDLNKVSFILEKYNHTLMSRAEELDVNIFIELANYLSK